VKSTNIYSLSLLTSELKQVLKNSLIFKLIDLANSLGIFYGFILDLNTPVVDPEIPIEFS